MRFTAYVMFAPRDDRNVVGVHFEHPDKSSLLELIIVANAALDPKYKPAGMRAMICHDDSTRWSAALCKWVPHRSPEMPRAT